MKISYIGCENKIVKAKDLLENNNRTIVLKDDESVIQGEMAIAGGITTSPRDDVYNRTTSKYKSHKKKCKKLKAPIIGIDRHRLTTDGEGVTTLVAFHGCPLHCKYCLNPQCLSPDGVLRTITPSELYSEVEIDDLYFVATGGGICFGGGEPLLHSKIHC